MDNPSPQKRRYCSHCRYPIQVCLCASIKKIQSSLKLVILQHPDEVSHAKNTARLVKLSIEDTQIIVGESAEDFAEFRRNCDTRPKDYLIIFPNQHSQAMETVLTPTTAASVTHLILIDGTWRKAKKIWQLNPWLQQLNSVHFKFPPQNHYRMRKTHVESSLSTLEAAAYSLNYLSQLDCSGLLTLLDAMQHQIERFIPEQVKTKN